MTEVTTGDGAVPGANPGPSTGLRHPLTADLIALVVAAAAVQVLFPRRIDLSAHVIAGGGAALAVAAALPSSGARWAAPGVALAVAVGALANEVLAGGVVDLGDVAYTIVGALFVARSASWVAASSRHRRLRVLGIAVAAVVVGWGLRHAR